MVSQSQIFIIESEPIHFGQYVVPLAAAKMINEYQFTLERFVGSAFFITGDGVIATCSHIIDDLLNNEFLVYRNMATGEICKLEDINCHPKFDFAIARTNITESKFIQPCEKNVYLGLDVLTFGYTSIGKLPNELKISTRMLKGYISRISIDNELPKTKETIELSFPSLSGFSGAPVWVWNTNNFAGMLFGNLESSIETFSFEERSESNSIITKEKIYRIMEFGLMHSMSTIKECIEYFGINAVNQL